jgi:hypothetical protein
MRLVLDGIAGVKFLADGGWQDCLAVIKAHFNFYGNFGSWHKKEKHSYERTDTSTYIQILS